MIMLCYHDLGLEEINPWVLDPRKFREQMQVLRDHEYRVVPLRQIDATTCRDCKSVVLSFDDGRQGCVRYALDILHDFAYAACFYVCTGFVEGTSIPDHERYSSFMKWDDIRLLAAAGQTVGSHAITHRSFQQLNPELRTQELMVSKGVIEDQLDCRCVDFASPYGYCDAKLVESARSSGYTTMATTVFGVNRSAPAVRPLKRWEVGSQLTTIEFERTLEALEARAQEYRVLLLPLAARLSLNGEWAVGQLAQYDLILSADRQALETLSHFGINCVDPQSLPLDCHDLTSHPEIAEERLREFCGIDEEDLEMKFERP